VDTRSVSRSTKRLVTFSDSVFAVTITLLVLEIRRPVADENLLHSLIELWPSYLAYAVTFLFVGQVWANHHVMFDHIRAADRAVLLPNTLLLMIVAFLPFATSVLTEAQHSGHGERIAVAFYGIAFTLTAAHVQRRSGSTRVATGCSVTPSAPPGQRRSAGVSKSPWSGSRPEGCSALRCRSSASP
jgi:uncharacterized membrane protein